MNREEASVPLDESGVETSHLKFPVVGIGASAGGLRALNTLFEHLPVDAGMAYVVVLHLSPRHDSNADRVLQRATRIPVQQVTGPTPIKANHIYVISPNSQLEMSDGHLHVTPAKRARGQLIAIDLFFRTLAAAHREHAIGVVLSGTGSDGSVGLGSVREMGGVTIAQLPEDAEYEDMPRNAVATGHVDFVLPAAEIPDRLVALRKAAAAVQLPPSADPEAPDAAAPGTASQEAERAVAEVLRIVCERTGHDFSSYKRATVLRRIERRLQIRSLPGVPAYRDYLTEHADETQGLLQDLLISVTSFFRDREAFEALERDVVPELFERREAGDKIRAWVAGCATGEEAYSLAMLLCEQAGVRRREARLQVFATDIDERALATARSGSYPGSIITDVPPSRLRDFFDEQGSRYRIRKSLRDHVLFAQHNVLRDPPFSQLDLVCCRNLLIYLDRSIQGQLLETFHFSLRPGGYLFLGTSEAADVAAQYFEVVDKKNRIFRAKTRPRVQRTIPTLPLASAPVTPEVQSLARQAGRGFSFAGLHQRVLEHYAPPSVVVDSDGSIVHLSDNAGRFLRFGAGEPSRNLLEIVHPELRLELRTALFEANNTGRSVEARGVRLQRDGKDCCINMLVRPFRDLQADQQFVLVLFDELADVKGRDSMDLASAGRGSTMGREPLHGGDWQGDDAVAVQLEEELRYTRERLQLTMEQSEASAEELRASNEELQAMNEELRSATEELETSKEELQSLNEELTTVNYELKLKVEETTRTNDDLQNFISSTDIATVFVDQALRIKRYTPRATTIFNTIPSDVGRCLLDITHRLDYEELAEDTAAVFDTLQPTEREVRSLDGRLYMGRIVPYRTTEHRIDGAVLTFVDVTRLRSAEARVAGGDGKESSTETRATTTRSDRAHAQAAAALKDEFLAVMSHELKQPLNLISVNAQVLARLPEVRGTAVGQRALENIQHSVRGQSRIIEDLLDLSRMRTGKLELARVPMDLVALAQRLVEVAQADASATELTIALDAPAEPVVVCADPVRIEQVLWNLIGNAIKFTPAGGSIAVQVGEEYGEARVDVRDTGQGVDPVCLSRMFEMFDQGEGRSARNRGGLGIGLALVRQIIELHDGHVGAASEGPGHGTTMSIWLPLHEDERFFERSTGDAPARAPALQGLRILVVDDNAATVDALSMLLDLEGADVVPAATGEEALALLRQHAGSIDLLLSDIGMPGMDGYALITAIRADPQLAKLPAIALTGFGRVEGGSRALEAGFSARLSKPVTMDMLIPAVSRLLREPAVPGTADS